MRCAAVCYRDSGAWATLAPATRRQRDNIFLHVVEAAGKAPFTEVTRKTIAAGFDRRRETPFAANNFLKTMRGLFRWAAENGFVEKDPTEGVRGQVPRTDGFHAWTEEEIAKFEAHWPVGSRERLAMTILLYSGLRRGDVARLGRQHVRDGVIAMRTEKTGTPIAIPVLPELAEVIAATQTGDLAFIATSGGAPMTKESLGNWFRAACKAAGVPGSAHGLRKAGATRAANNGATLHELEAIYGWSGGKMASLYTRQADRVRLAREAMGKLGKGKTGTSIPAPDSKVRAPWQRT
jgi:integrase